MTERPAEGAAELLGRREVYRGRTFDVDVDRVRLPNGREAEMEIVRHHGATAIVPVLGDGTVLLIRQYRYATGGWLLEVPAGSLDGDESPEAGAARETQEEVGYRPTRLDSLGWIWTTPGFTDEKIWLFLATGLEETEQELEADEILSVERLPLADAVEMALAGEIHDSKSVTALLRAARAFETQKGSKQS